jgi:hypothetical protein
LLPFTARQAPGGRRKIKAAMNPCKMFLILFGLLIGQFARADHTVVLRGIVQIPGLHLALIQIDGENWVLGKAERFTVGSNPKVPAEVLELDPTNEIVITRVDGQNHTNSLAKAGRPPTSGSWIHLQEADFRTAMGFYGRAIGRTILLHPRVSTAPFSCEASWPNENPGTNEIAACFVTALNQRGTAAAEDGDRFLVIIPAAMTQSVSLGAKDLPASNETIASGAINFEGVPLDQAIGIYGQLIGRERKENGARFESGARIYLQTVGPLSKPQVIYALETLVHWNSGKITLYDDNTFGVTPDPEMEK